MLPEKSFDWQSLWTDLLQGVGAGLLHNDGSRLAQSALAGLDAFDLARERRERRKSHGSEGGEGPFALPLSNMSAAELAAFSRLTPDLQRAFKEELAAIGLEDDLTAQGQSDYGEYRPTAPLPTRREPLSPNPLEEWWRTRNLPFGSDGRMNLPTWQR